MEVYGLWHGGDSYSEGTVFDSLELFPSIERAKWEFSERYNSNGQRMVDFYYAIPGNENVQVYVPAVNERATMKLWFVDPRNGWYTPDRIIEFGARMGVRIKKVPA